MEWLKKDNIFNGVLMGMMTFISTYCLISGADWLRTKYLNLSPFMIAPRIQLLMLFMNMLLFRWLMITKEQTEKGRGVLLITFVVTIAYVYSHKVKI